MRDLSKQSFSLLGTEKEMLEAAAKKARFVLQRPKKAVNHAYKIHRLSRPR